MWLKQIEDLGICHATWNASDKLQNTSSAKFPLAGEGEQFTVW